VRIVFDTNVLFSAFTAHGTCAGLYEECLQWAQMVVSQEILKELEEKLASKAKLNPVEIHEILAAIRDDSQIVETVPLSKRVCRDPDDDAILAAAVSAEADVIVTGDSDLLVLERFGSISILNPRGCLVRLSAEGNR